MKCGCFLWIPNIWKDLLGIFPCFKIRDVSPLPNEIIFDILSRLPADEVLKCRSVSKDWKAVASTRLFSQIHLKKASPTVFMQLFSFKQREVDSFYYCMDLFFLDAAKKTKMIQEVPVSPMLNRDKSAHVVAFSYNGFIVFRTTERSSYIFIHNPITKEEIVLAKPSEIDEVCGMYYHLMTREYRLIYVCQDRLDNKWQYVLFSQLTSNWRMLCTFCYAPDDEKAPVNINGFIYWMVSTRGTDFPHSFPTTCSTSIITFNIETEELRCWPHPGSACHSLGEEHSKMYLFQMNGNLLFCRIGNDHIKIWELQGTTEWLWIERYSINLVDGDFVRYPANVNLPVRFFTLANIKLVNIIQGELLICWHYKGFFMYHLERKTLRKLDVQLAGTNFNWIPYSSLHLISYTKSLESWSKHV